MPFLRFKKKKNHKMSILDQIGIYNNNKKAYPSHTAMTLELGPDYPNNKNNKMCPNIKTERSTLKKL